MDREFSLEEANAAVAELRPVVERMVEHGRRLAAAQRDHMKKIGFVNVAEFRD